MALEDVLRPCEDPDHSDWYEWRVPGPFNRDVIGRLLVREEADGMARTRIVPAPHMGNVHGMIHGGVITALADATLFAGPGLLTRQDLGASVTVDLSVQFIGAGSMDAPLDGLVSILRETGRMMFCQGRIVQGENPVAGFSGIVRKITA
ncbi:PaaI family thioesterase [Croceibacterium aestuarii]|uniref:PaaI family thioesterase n=1 Tax=Croceibacterium aestuarii TaxID=3064139 RepID=UPI00272E3601|nr:PaaI family thioesterase [Croceibacterium sp. D39]